MILIVGMVVSPSPGQSRPLSERLHGSVLPSFRDLERDDVGSYGIVGDSVSLITSSYNWYLRNYLTSDYGSAGDGYLALARFTGVRNATAGKQWFWGYIYDLLTQAGHEALLADANSDRWFDFFDVLDFLIAFTRATES